jgi:transcriptional regulator with XRE-family HTH domain
LRSEGQRLLLLLPDTGKAIAARVGATPPAVSQWKQGDREPHAPQRRALEAEFGVPFAAWGIRPKAGEPVPSMTAIDEPEPEPAPAPPPAKPTPKPQPVAPRVVEAPTETPPLPALHVEDPLGSVRALVARASAGIQMQGLSAGEQKSWQDQLLNAMKMADALQDKQEAREDVLARTPAFKALFGRVIEALEPYPDALAAVRASVRAALGKASE